MISLVADQTRREHVKLMEKIKKGSGTTDLTVGRPLPQILKFALPLVLGTLFQQLYSFVDTVIVGRCLGTDALGAVGTTYSLNFLILGFVLGSCTGFGIPVAQSFGARDSEDMHKYLFNGAVLCVALSVVFTIVTTLTAAPLLQLIHTPAELFPDAVAYIRIIFLGIPATVLFNYTSTVLHSLGDSQHPFYFLLISSFLNIGLDWLFIVPLGMGVEGAAIATFISQAVGGVLPVFYFLNRKNTSLLHLCRPQFEGGVLLKACVNGSSELMTNLSMSLVNILYNYQLLRFAGEDGVAAYGVIMYASFLFVAVFVGYAVGSAPIVSYHYGANNRKEVNNLYRKSLKLIGVVAVVMTIGSMFIIPHVARFFVGYDENLLILTTRAFRLYGLSFLIMGFNVYASSFFTALGDGVTSALISFLRTLLFQVAAVLLLPLLLGIDGIWLAVTAAELAALLVSIGLFITRDQQFHYRKAE